MADQFHDSMPAMGNQIADDVPDISETLGFLKDCFENFCKGWSNTFAANLFPHIVKDDDEDTMIQLEESADEDTIRFDAAGSEICNIDANGLNINAGSNLTVNSIPFVEEMIYGLYNRTQTTYNGGATAYTIKLKAASYICKDKYCFWTTELTTTAIGTPAADTWYYLYLDYSAITSETAITNSELLWSTTAPSFNTTYRCHMNGDDRCIFAVKTNSTPDNILEYFHYGNFIAWADQLAGGQTGQGDYDYENIAGNVCQSDDCYMVIPGFCTMAKVGFQVDGNGDFAKTKIEWYTKGQTGTTGKEILIAQRTGTDPLFNQAAEADVITNSSQVIVVNSSTNDVNIIVSVYTNGWFLPEGM
jgi:hypothetical protein